VFLSLLNRKRQFKFAWRMSVCILLLLKVCWSQSFAAEYPQPAVRFERASKAYLEGASYEPNIPRLKQVVIPSVSDGRDLPYAGDSSDIHPVITYNGVLYGIQGPGHTGKVYKSVDGGNKWVQALSSTLISALFETPEGNLLGGDGI